MTEPLLTYTQLKVSAITYRNLYMYVEEILREF